MQKAFIMNQLYPLKFTPQFFEKIWGGQKILKTFSNTPKNMANCGEVWLLSALKGKESIVNNGFLSGNTINELSEIYMGDLLGESVFEKAGGDFPLLFKILDSSDWLSVQVHPDNDLAQKKHKLAKGKNEMWYIIDADSESTLISGFNKSIDQNAVKNAISNKNLKSLLKEYKISSGDSFYIPAGMVHAIGPGALIAEIQESSDITYRLWDWDRTDNEGNKRDLHIEDSLDALKYEFEKGEKNEYIIPENGSSNLISCSPFTSNLIKISKGMLIEKDIFPIDSFICYLCTEGSANIISENASESINKGEVLLIPAVFNNLQILSAESCTLIETYIK